jgi:NAD(P)-dependent dehydrogenase (short-subunit alcohol dehydrogenase family)
VENRQQVVSLAVKTRHGTLMKTVLVVGASRGLGFEFVQQYLSVGWRVLATARKKSDLARLERRGAVAHQLDVTRPEHFAALKTALARRAGDVAIYNAGVLGRQGDATGVRAIPKSDFDSVMHTNVWGAMHAVPAVGPCVARAARQGGGVFVFVSSVMGSLNQMTNAQAVIYRASKSALNAVAKASALEWADKSVVTLALHPGWVRTDMGGADADLDVSHSVAAMRRFITRAKQRHNGRLFDHTGKALPW